MKHTYTDKELLDWLEKQNGCGLISDDCGRWAVSTTGMQNVNCTDKPIDIDTSFFVEAREWKKSIREALKFAIREESKNE